MVGDGTCDLQRSAGNQTDCGAQSNQLFLLAPEEIHQQVARRLAEKAAPQTPSLDAAAPSRRDIASAQDISQRPRRIPETPTERRADNFSSPALAPGSYAEVDRLLPLRSLAVSDLEQRLIALFGRRLRALQREGHETLLLPIDEQRALEFQLDRGRNLVLVRGPGAVVQQFSQLVEALDSGSRTGQKTQAVRVERAAPEKLQEAVDAYRGGTPGPPPPRPANSDQSSNSRPGSGLRLVNYLFQQQPGVGGGLGDPAAPGGELDSSIVPNVPGLEDLEVQTLPDLDVIIIRGRDQDVEQLTKIIRELERLSAETIPKILIYPLKHTQGEAVKEILDEVQTDLVGRRQGRVTITPLIKPNALLIIGWGEAVEAVSELITKLDRPVPPESQFAVFALQHAAVTTVQQTVTQFFGARGGLAPRVETAADTRTNSLIVYAAPRDMQEVERLVRELDVPQSGAVNRAQIFRVYNALASDVAQTLQQAISASQAGQSGRSAVLELMAVDEQGQEVVRSGMLSEVNITPNPRNNTLVVTGPPGAMGLIEAFIEQLDTPWRPCTDQGVSGDQRRCHESGHHAPVADPFASRSATWPAIAHCSGRGVAGAAAILGGSAQQQYHRRRFRG